MTAVKLKRIGNSVGVIIPRDVLARMTFDEGDTLFLTETPGGYRRTPYEPEFEAQMAAARRIMKKQRSALRELAK